MKRCSYCDFAIAPYSTDGAARYLARLEQELEQLPAPASLRTVYIGGGTPSALSHAELQRLLTNIRGRLAVDPDEWTLEANPESVDAEKAALLHSFGIHRISLGAQSSSATTLQAIGRDHDPADTGRALQLLRQAGVRNINIDLMFAAPEQSMAELEVDLDRLLELDPDHVSTYCLTYEDNTPMTLAWKNGKVARADDETELEFYRLVRQRLAEAGYVHYEISNFAKPGRESLHNQVYWKGREYFGVGLGAASYVNGVRRTNTRHLAEYLGDWQGRPPHESEELDPPARARELVILGLRMREGLEESRVRQLGFSLEQLYPDRSLDRLLQQGLLSRANGRLCLTERGLELADHVSAELV